MILTETHLHTSVSSYCGMVHPSKIPWLYKKANYKAIIVTDHFYSEGMMHKTVDEWLEGYRLVRDEGKLAGIKVFLGMELRFNYTWEDYLVYGFDEAFLKKNRSIYELSLEDAYQLLESYGFVIYQAHPFRHGLSVSDPALIHGVEVNNGNPRHRSHNKKALAYAKKHSLLMISGSDFHQHGDPGSGGIYLDKGIETEKELAQFLRGCTERKEQFLYYGSKKPTQEKLGNRRDRKKRVIPNLEG